ncbi:inorganic diphosphatase [candidate division KSB1 bacterium]|nr:inorganic diphosphatase [candidate division KSB1 bacterium]NIR69855.1 inorganic diphosphatase [candidate division KSB1 bacterium]NIS22975.1 inorganic diphosphatase [candidate division KSB1 bacterium]NIT69832.1 inorganic diphosphatase [candidate division KSB1 bacterium]NIU25754.1 inorganic diphosphatase [candidate division KSB1 bacterium]
MKKHLLLIVVTILVSTTLVFSQTSATDLAAGLKAVDQYTLVGEKSFLTGYEAQNPDGSINVVVEIPAGTTAKWEVTKPEGHLKWEFRDGKPRVVKYLSYPGNYGMVPRTLLPKELGGDGDPLDVIVLGPAVPRGSVVRVRLIGVLKLLDDGERDDKLLAAIEGESLANVDDLDDLNESFPGVTTIIETWFSNYKGPGVLKSEGFLDVDEAERILESAIKAFGK